VLEPEVLRDKLPHPGALLLHSLTGIFTSVMVWMSGWGIAVTGLGQSTALLFAAMRRCRLLQC